MISNSQIFYINSRNRISGTNSNFSYAIEIDRTKSYTHVCCLQLSIPKSFYLIQEESNTFTLQEGILSATITIPKGNYNINSLESNLTTLLNTASPNGWTYSITYPNTNTSADSGKFTYSVSGNSGVQPQFIFTTYLYEQLGFEQNSTNTFVANSLESVNVLNLQREGTLYLYSNIANNGGDAILQEVFSNNDPDFGSITYQCTSLEGYSKQLAASSNNVYHFTLCDENGIEIDLNGQNLLCTIQLYQKIDFTKFPDFIKYFAQKF